MPEIQINIVKVSQRMQTLNIYSYFPVISVQFSGDPNIRTRNRQVYSPDIKLYKNTSNPVRLLLKNQDQKPINITDFSVVIDLCDAANNVVVNRYTATVVNAVKGICDIIIPAMDLNELEARYYYFTVRKKSLADEYDEPAFIDDNYSVKLTVELMDGFLSYDDADNPLDLGYVYDPNATILQDLGTL